MADNKKHSKRPLEHKILIVDDEYDFVEILTDILQSRGYIIESANSTEEACNKIEDFEADVALLDIRLGLESGINLLSWIKEKRPSIICVMMTAYAAITTAIEAIQKGAYDYLRKPIETQELLFTLDRCFEKIRLENERDAAESILKEKNKELVNINERLRTIVKSTHSLTTASGIGEMGRLLLDEFANNMAVEGGSLYFVEDNSLLLAHTLDPGHAPEKIPLPLKKNTILEQVMRTGEVILIKDIEQMGKIQKSGWKGYNDGSLLVFPLHDPKGNIKGIITLHNKSQSAFTVQDSEIGQILASYSYEALLASEAIEEVNEGRKNLQTLFDTMEDFLFIYNFEGKIVHVNPAVERGLGYTAKELLGTRFHKLLTTNNNEDIMNIVTEIIKGKAKFCSFLLNKKDGTLIPVESTGAQGQWDGDDVIFLISRAITERLLAEEALRQSEQRYRELIENAIDVIYTLDLSGNIIDLNEAFIQESGYSREELIGKNIQMIVHPDDLSKAKEYFKKGSRGESFQDEMRTIDKVGNVKWFSFISRPVANKDSSVTNINVISRNITARVMAEEALRQSEQKFRELIENALDIIYILDINGKLIDFNEAFLRESGYKRKELIGRSLRRFIHPDYLFIAKDQFEKSLRGESCQSEIQIINRDGSIKWFSFISQPVISKDGSVAAINVVARDITARVMAEEALRESEDKYRTVVENAKEAILVLQEGKIKFFNPKTMEISGYSEEELNSAYFEKFIYPEDREKVRERYVRDINGEDFPKPNLFKIYRKDRKPRWVEGIGISIIWEGKPASLNFLSDVTEKMTVESALIESEVRYLTLMENLPIGVYRNLPDEKGKLLMANPAFLEMFEIDSKKELEEICASDFYHNPEDRILFSNNLLENGSVTGSELKLKKLDGTPIWVSVTAKVVYSDDGKPLHFDCAIEDISERKAAEEAFRKSEEMYRDLFQSSRDTIYLSTTKGNFIDINLAGQQLFGYTRNELLKLKINNIYNDSNERENFQKIVEQQGFVIDYEITFKKKDGTLIDTLVTSVLRKDEAGNVIGYQGIIKDVTDKKRLEAQLIQTQKMEAVGNLAGGMAHNFNNILVGIMGYSEYLLGRKEKDDPDYKALKTIHDGTLRASELTKQLLNIARGQEFRFTKLNINDVVEKVLPLISGTFEKSIDIETHLKDDLLAIDGDRGHLEQCLLNLCINAKDAMPKGGRLIIETKNQKMDEEFFRTHINTHEGDYVALFITDTGIGMTNETKERIFEPFYSTKENRGGTGMGLSTVYGIMKKHSGIITVYSEIGEGSTFKLYFPAVTGIAKTTETEMEIRKITGDETLLIIDDEPVVVDMWRDFLEDMGYTVLTAVDGEEGIAIFKKKTGEIDLVILDYVLPGISGMETFKKLKEIDPKVKVLISSGYSENGQANNILNEGGDGFVQKPTRLNLLSSKIRGILDK